MFLAFGGFDPRLYPRPAIEDIELGYRLTRAGHRIVLARDVLATHMKRWTLAEMVRTDIFRRGVPWAILIKRTATVETDLNVKSDQKACVVLTGLGLIAALACAATPWAGLVALAAMAGIVVLNRGFFAFLVRRKGLAFACAVLSLAPDLLLLLWALGRDRSGSLVHKESRQGRDRFNPAADANRSRDGPDSQAGGRALGAGYRAGGRDRNSLRGSKPTDSHQRPAHENWNRWKLPLESARLWPVHAAACRRARRTARRAIDFVVFVDRPSAENVVVPPPFDRVVVPVRRSAQPERRRPRGAGAGATCSPWGWPSPGRGIDLMYFPATYSFFPVWNVPKLVVTMHDTLPFSHPELVFPGGKRTAGVAAQGNGRGALGRPDRDGLRSLARRPSKPGPAGLMTGFA